MEGPKTQNLGVQPFFLRLEKIIGSNFTIFENQETQQTGQG